MSVKQLSEFQRDLIRSLAHEDGNARVFLRHLAERKNRARATSVDLLARLAHCDPGDARKTYRRLESLECGRYRKASNRMTARFVWQVDSKEAGRVLAIVQ